MARDVHRAAYGGPDDGQGEAGMPRAPAGMGPRAARAGARRVLHRLRAARRGRVRDPAAPGRAAGAGRGDDRRGGVVPARGRHVRGPLLRAVHAASGGCRAPGAPLPGAAGDVHPDALLRARRAARVRRRGRLELLRAVPVRPGRPAGLLGRLPREEDAAVAVLGNARSDMRAVLGKAVPVRGRGRHRGARGARRAVRGVRLLAGRREGRRPGVLRDGLSLPRGGHARG